MNNIFRCAIAVGAVCFVAPVASQSIVPIGNAKLSSLMMQVKDFKPKDAFAAPPKQAYLAGQSFSISWPLKNGNETHMGITTSGYWAYDPAAGKLTIRVASSGLSYHPDTYFFEGATKAGRPYAAQNGFGASTTVKPYESFGFGVQSTQKSPPFEIVVDVAGDAARQMVGSLRLVMEGEFTDAGVNGPISCTKDAIAPRVDRPVEIIMTKCLALVTLERVSIVRTDTGQVLGAWKSAGSN